MELAPKLKSLVPRPSSRPLPAFFHPLESHSQALPKTATLDLGPWSRHNSSGPSGVWSGPPSPPPRRSVPVVLLRPACCWSLTTSLQGKETPSSRPRSQYQTSGLKTIETAYASTADCISSTLSPPSRPAPTLSVPISDLDHYYGGQVPRPTSISALIRPETTPSGERTLLIVSPFWSSKSSSFLPCMFPVFHWLRHPYSRNRLDGRPRRVLTHSALSQRNHPSANPIV